MELVEQGNKGRQITVDLMGKLPSTQTNKRGITIDGMVLPNTMVCHIDCSMSILDHLRMAGASDNIFAIGDCTASSYAPTAQVASQQGAYLARQFAQLAKKDNIEAQLVALKSAPQTKEAQTEMESLQKSLEKIKLKPFQYSHQGSLA